MEQRDDHLKLLPPPEFLPYDTHADSPSVSYFALTNYVSQFYRARQVFGIKRDDRRRHLYIVGKSGMGKTKLLELLIRFDLSFDHALAVVDPHGDLIEDLLHAVPEHRISDVVYVDPSDAECPIAFNPFANVPAPHRMIVTQGLIEIFKKQFGATWTPRMEHLFRFATLATLEDPEGTLYGLLQLLTDAHERQRVLTHVKDQVVRRFFAVEFTSFSERYDAEAITPLVNRLGQFFADPLMRAIFSQKENAIDFHDIMNNNKVLLLNLSKGNLGEENSALFGAIFLTKLNQTAMARVSMPEKERKPFYLYVDEFQNVATQSFTTLLSESRKYGVCITVANQHLTQLPSSLVDSLFGNVGTLIAFRVSGADAVRLAEEFGEELAPQDFTNLGLRDVYIKMQVDGRTTAPFSAHIGTVEPPAISSQKDLIVRHSRDLYCKQLSPEQTPAIDPVIDQDAFESPAV